MPKTKEQFEELREKKKDIIFTTALRLFAEKGYHNTSINDIAKVAKISTGLAYHYFTSKQNILEAIIEEWLETTDRLFKEFDKSDNPIKKMRDIIETVFGMIETNKELWKLYVTLLVQPGVFKKIKKMALKQEQKYINALVEIIASLGFSKPLIEAKFFDVFLDGIWLNFLKDEEDFPLQEMKEFLLQRYSKEGIAKLIKTKN